MSTNASTKVIIAALIGNAAISITKFFAAFMTGSSAMLSEGIHSLVDTGNQVLLLHGMKQAKKPADEAFPFGHGKEIYFWSFVVAILIFAVGSGVSIYEGIRHVIHPSQIQDLISDPTVAATQNPVRHRDRPNQQGDHCWQDRLPIQEPKAGNGQLKKLNDRHSDDRSRNNE